MGHLCGEIYQIPLRGSCFNHVSAVEVWKEVQVRRKPAMRTALATALAVACLVLGVAFFQSFPDASPAQNGRFSQFSEEVDQGVEVKKPSVGNSSNNAGATEAAVLSESDTQTGDGVSTRVDELSAERVEDQVMVLLADGSSIEQFNESLARLDYVATEEVSEQDVALGWVKLDLKPGSDLDWALDELEQCDAVAESQPNFVYHLLDEGQFGASPVSTLATSGDTLVAGAADLLTQTAINDAVALATNDNRWWLEAVDAYKAWDQARASGAVTVAVIDTGCACSHEDLSKVVSASNCYNALTGAVGFDAVHDVDGHGTHVCGILAAEPNNGIGIAGISYGASLMPVKVVNADTTSTAYLVKAYQFIMKRRAAGVNVRIANVSLGGSKGYDSALMRVIDQAYYEYGILSVFAAGNEGEKAPYYCFPCDFSEVGLGVISVGPEVAESLRGRPDPTSNYNLGSEKTKEISAPGVGIVSTYPVALSSTSRYGKGYKKLTGTSMAAPIVSGIAALIWTRNPSLSPGEVKSVLCSTADDIRAANGQGVGFDAYTGYGLVNAAKAVAGARSCYIKGKDAVAVGSSIRLAVAQSGTWRWSSSEGSVASVSADGQVTGLSPGETVISALNVATGAKVSSTIVVYESRVLGKSQVAAGKKITLGFSCTPVATCAWTSSNTKIATVGSTTGKVEGLKVGVAVIKAQLTAAPHIKLSKKVRVVKGPNTMVLKAKTKKVAYADLKRKSKKVSGAIVFTRAAKGKVTYERASGGSSSRLSVNKKTGKITVKKGTPRGTYRIKVRVRAAGNASYKSRTRTVTVKIKVV